MQIVGYEGSHLGAGGGVAATPEGETDVGAAGRAATAALQPLQPAALIATIRK
jgi:hypothetical protein